MCLCPSLCLYVYMSVLSIHTAVTAYCLCLPRFHLPSTNSLVFQGGFWDLCC